MLLLFSIARGGFPFTPKSSGGPWDRQKYPHGQTPFSGEPHPKMKRLPKVLAPPPKKEIVFPPGSVESQKAVKVKRKILHSKDIGMCLHVYDCIMITFDVHCLWMLRLNNVSNVKHIISHLWGCPLMVLGVERVLHENM